MAAKVVAVRGIRHCQNVKCGAIMNRDYNAAINIRRNPLNYINTGAWLPRFSKRNVEDATTTSTAAASFGNNNNCYNEALPLPPLTQRPFPIAQGLTPINEFEDNDRLFLGGFPDLFFLGHGIEHHRGRLQFNTCFYKRTFVLLRIPISPLLSVFNKLQRHQGTVGVAARVKTNNQAMTEFIELVNKPADFNEQLSSAIADPSSRDATILSENLQKLVRLTGGTVPWGPVERAQTPTQLFFGLIHYCGVPNWFITASPADLDSVLMLRLSHACGTEEFNLPIELNPDALQRSTILSSNPAAAAAAKLILIAAVPTLTLPSFA